MQAEPTPTQPLGRRARATKEALNFASSKVIGTLTLERMIQCFPDRDEKDLMVDLQKMVSDNYQHFIEEAWELVMEPKAAQEATRHTDAQPAIRGFIDTANELDQILAEAEARRDAGEVPKDLWLKGADAEATVRHATADILSAEIETLRAKRLALVEKNRTTYAAIATTQVQAEKIDANIQSIVSDFQQSLVVLDKIDFSEVEGLQSRMMDVVPASMS